MNKKELLEKLSLEDKAALLVGYTNMTTKPMPSLGIPSLVMSDGPNGVRRENSAETTIDNSVKTLPATCFPCGSALAASWDNNLMYEVGKAIALECRYYGINAILGPAINIKRNPLCGRNFEYLSEDPFLAGFLSASYIKGVQDQKVLACVKHYACNNLEKWRYVGDSVVDLRALNDIYLKPFELAIRESNPGMLMSSYNQINGCFASENKYLLEDRLRGKFSYKGLTVTDWGGMVHRDISLTVGQDLEMPGMVKENIQSIVDGVNKNLIPVEQVDNAVLRLLEAIEKTRVEPNKDEKAFENGKEVALKGAIRSAVLLKNENNALPLSKDKKYLIIGDLFQTMRFQGSGSALINAREIIDNKKAFDDANIQYEFVRGYDVNNPKVDPRLEEEAIEKAKEAEEIIFFGGLTDLSESEGFDRKDMKLDGNQEHLLKALTEFGKKIVFVMYGGSPFEIPSHEKIGAMLYMNLPGECGGLALTKLLFGEVSPSGKLAFTWPEKYDDVPYGEKFNSCPNELYKESIFVGYRYYNTSNKKVLFPFGHGLTYGHYHFEDFNVESDNKEVKLSFNVINDSDVAIGAIAQIYVHKVNSDIPRPNKELKTYARIDLNPRDKQIVTLSFKVPDLAVFDRKSGNDVVEDGNYIIYLSESVEIDAFSKEISVKGEKLSPLESEQPYLNTNNIENVSDDEFFNLIERRIDPYKPSKKPYTMETPICEFNSFFGKIIKKEMLKQGDKVINAAKRCKDENERIRQIKSGTFMKMMMLQNCLRSLAFSAGGLLPYKKAQGLLDLANGHIFRVLKKLLSKSK